MLRRSPLSTLFPYTTLFRSLNAVAERIGWSKPAPSGVHRGLAHLHCFDSFVAAACEISVKDGNKVKVHRIVAATDPRSEEHTSELQSHHDLVCRLLHEKKNI